MGEHNRTNHNKEAAIQKTAYELWEKDGRPEGRDQSYWFAAEKAVKGQFKK